MATRRTAIYLFHDPAGKVDDYVLKVLDGLRPYLDHVLVVVNGRLRTEGRSRLGLVAEDVLVRENTGLDVGGYRAGLDRLGWERLADLEELVLLNNTFFAPVRPWGPVFDSAAEASGASFWGLTEHAELRPHPFLARRLMPRHIQSHFMALRAPVLKDPAFREYWRTMPPVRDYNDSVAHHESRFTSYFNGLGHESHVVFPLELFASSNPSLEEPSALMEAGCPVLKRRVLFHDPLYLSGRGVDGASLIRQAGASGCEPESIVSGVVRAAEPRVLVVNAGLTEVLAPDGGPRPAAARTPSEGSSPPPYRAHLMVHRVDDLRCRLPLLLDDPDLERMVVCCSDEAVRRQVEALLRRNPLPAEVRTAAHPTAGGLVSLLTDAVDLLADDAVVLRLEPVGGGGPGRAVDDPVAGTRGRLISARAVMERHPSLGVLIRTAPVSGSCALGHGWEGLRESAAALAARAGIRTPLDSHSPLWSYGWSSLLRSRALAALRTVDHDGLVARHGPRSAGAVLERLVVPAAASEGLHCRQVLAGGGVSSDYGALEYRYQSLAALLSADPQEQQRYLAARSGADASLGAVVRRGLESRAPGLADRLKPAYRRATGAVSRLAQWRRPRG